MHKVRIVIKAIWDFPESEFLWEFMNLLPVMLIFAFTVISVTVLVADLVGLVSL